MGTRRRALKAVDFFCGAGGMSYGLKKAGIDVLAGIDNDADCRKTYTKNVRSAKFIKHDISTLSPAELGRRLGLRRDDPKLVLAGCSPCQFWSKIRTDKSKSQKTALLLKQFQKFIRYFRPGFVVVENVPGLYSRRSESILASFIGFLNDCGYAWADGVVNSSVYGVPQNRMRYLLIATRLNGAISLPTPARKPPLTVASFLGVANGFKRIAAGETDKSDPLHCAAALSAQNLRRISLTPKSGGCRDAWKDIKELQIPAYEGKDDFFKDVYGRMRWDRPAPTITTRFNSLSNGRFGHPVENRAISIREGAALQTFPKSFRFYASTFGSMTRQIGNAVPPELARRIGKHLIAIYENG